MTITERKRQANRENALKSTGPKSEEGKRVVSMNALVHGARAESHILPGDEPDEVRAFFNAYIAELSPEDGVQLSLANRMAGVAWKIERLSRAERDWVLSEQLRSLKKQQNRKESEDYHAGRRAKQNEIAPWEPVSPERLLASNLENVSSTQGSLWDLQLKLERVLLSMYRLYRQLKKDGPGEELPTNLHESARMENAEIKSATRLSSSKSDFADCADLKCETGDDQKSDSSSAKSAQSADQSDLACIRDDSCRFVADTFSAPNKANVKMDKVDGVNDVDQREVKRE